MHILKPTHWRSSKDAADRDDLGLPPKSSFQILSIPPYSERDRIYILNSNTGEMQISAYLHSPA
jgi:hypothetical protein